MANFKYVEKVVASEDILDAIKTEITNFTEYPYEATAGESPETNRWEVFQEETDAATGKTKTLILKGVTSIGQEAQTKEFYVKLQHNCFENPDKHSSLTLQVLDEYDSQAGDWNVKGCPVVYEFAKEDYTPTDRNSKKPVYMYLNIMNNRLAMVLVADPAVNFNDYRKSFMYVGAIKPFKFNEYDVVGNILLTAGSVTAEPTNAELESKGYYFGEYTSPGNNSFQMLRTKSGILFQKHYPAFITQAPPAGKAYVDQSLGDTGLVLEQQGFQASRWTGKYHMSPIYVVHPYEGYRGMLEQCLAVTKHNILHLDELIVDVEGKPWVQEVYKYFDINTENNFMRYSPNIEMGVAILKEVRYAS